MKYRLLEEKDIAGIVELCKRYNIEYNGKSPALGLVAEGNSGEIIGVAYAHNATIVEPFICENPTSAVKLFMMLDGALVAARTKISLVHVQSQDELLAKELPKAGFVPIEGHTVYKKVL